MDTQTKSQVVGAVTGGLGGALVGAIAGYLIDRQKGAAWGAGIGGVSMAVVGALPWGSASSSSSSTGTGARRAPLEQVMSGYGRGLPQLSPMHRMNHQHA